MALPARNTAERQLRDMATNDLWKAASPMVRGMVNDYHRAGRIADAHPDNPKLQLYAIEVRAGLADKILARTMPTLQSVKTDVSGTVKHQVTGEQLRREMEIARAELMSGGNSIPADQIVDVSDASDRDGDLGMNGNGRGPETPGGAIVTN